MRSPDHDRQSFKESGVTSTVGELDAVASDRPDLSPGRSDAGRTDANLFGKRLAETLGLNPDKITEITIHIRAGKPTTVIVATFDPPDLIAMIEGYRLEPAPVPLAQLPNASANG
jgi:hypothetical protein